MVALAHVTTIIINRKSHEVHDMQISPESGEVITVVAGMILIAAAFAWLRYAIPLQQRAERMMRHAENVHEDNPIHRLTQKFGVAFLVIVGVFAVIFGIAHLLSR